MKNNIWFVIVTYRFDNKKLNRLLKALAGQHVKIVDNSKKNRGYGGGANVGIKFAVDRGGEWVVICNQDISLTKTAVSKLLETLAKSPPAIVGPERGSFDERRWTTILPAKDKTDYISGSLMAIHWNVFEKIGYFYEPYFMYYEDADFCVRAKKAGFPLKRIKLVGFRHQNKDNSVKNYYLARNHLLFVIRNAPWKIKFAEFLRLPKTIYDYWR